MLCVVCEGSQYADWCCLDSRGSSGGILLVWDRRVVEKIEECVLGGGGGLVELIVVRWGRFQHHSFPSGDWVKPVYVQL